MKPRNTRPGSKGSFILLFIIIVLVLIGIYVYQAHRHDVPPSDASGSPSGTGAHPAALPRLEVPAPHGGDMLVTHQGYTLGFHSDAAQASWVAYILTAGELATINAPRTNNFRLDPSVTGRQASDADYEGSGFDRGHLAPAEDLSYSRATMSESFYYSNMSPQVPAFNRGVWKRLEELTRFWATTYDSIYIVTGPVLKQGLPVIGPDQVAVPEQYFKAILLYGRNGVRGIGFLLRNEASAATLKSFAVPIDEVEQATGLDLFPQLPDEQENVIESDPKVAEWPWTRKKVKMR
jgi:endonuclease G